MTAGSFLRRDGRSLNNATRGFCINASARSTSLRRQRLRFSYADERAAPVLFAGTRSHDMQK